MGKREVKEEIHEGTDIIDIDPLSYSYLSIYLPSNERGLGDSGIS